MTTLGLRWRNASSHDVRLKPAYLRSIADAQAPSSFVTQGRQHASTSITSLRNGARRGTKSRKSCSVLRKT